MNEAKVVLSLGANLGDPLSCIKRAAALLSAHASIGRLKISNFYKTSPVQVNTPVWFVNAVCSFYTSLPPIEIFHLVQNIEIELGKTPKAKNESRLIDIDILFYGTQIFNGFGLEIPHPRWKERLFVLMPLADLINEVSFEGPKGLEHFIISDLIKEIDRSLQITYLLEKNPDLQ